MNFTDIMGKAGGAAGGIAGIVNTAVEAAQIKDTTKEWNLIHNIKNTMVDLDSYDLLELLWNNTSFANTGYKQKDVRGLTGWQQAGKVLSAAGLGAATGAQVAGGLGALAGTVAGLGAGIAGVFTGNAKAAKEANKLNYEGMLANQSFLKNFENNNKNIAMNNKNQALLNVAAFGGPLYANPFSNGVRFIEKGGSHEENPLGGVPQGMAPDGLPNLVEEGEVIFNDYVYSKRLKVPKKDYAMLGLKGKKEYTYADAATEIQRESEERPNDPLSKRNLESMFARLQTSQDELKEKRDAQKMKREFDKMSPEELAYMLQAMQGEQQAPSQEIPVQQSPMMAAYGGHLFEYGGTPFVYTSTDNTADGPREVYFYNPGYINGDTDLDFPYNILAYDPFVQNGLDVLLELANTNHNNEITTSQNVLNKRELPPLNFNPFGYKFSNPSYKSPSLDLTFGPADKTIVNDPLGYGYRFLDPSYKSPVTDLEIQKTPASAPKEDDESVKSNDTDAAVTPKQGSTTTYWNNTTDSDWVTTLPTAGKGQYVVQRTNDAGQTLYHIATGDPSKATGIYLDESGNWVVGTPPLESGFSSNLLLRAMPIVGNLASAFTSIFDKPNYDNLEKAEQMFRQIPNIGPKPVGDMMLYNPTDINYLSTQLGNQLARARRTVMENSGGNSAAAMLNLLSTNYKGQEALSEAFRQGMEYNDNKYNTVVDFNRGTNTFNSEQALQSAVQNQLMAYNKALQSLNIANLKNQESAATQKVKSDSLSNLFTSLGNYGKDSFAREQVRRLVETGAYEKQSDEMLKLFYDNYFAEGGFLHNKSGFGHIFAKGGNAWDDLEAGLERERKANKKKQEEELKTLKNKEKDPKVKKRKIGYRPPQWVREITSTPGGSTVRVDLYGVRHPDNVHDSNDLRTYIDLEPRRYELNEDGTKAIVDGVEYDVLTDEITGGKYFEIETRKKDKSKGFSVSGWYYNDEAKGVSASVKREIRKTNPYKGVLYPHYVYRAPIGDPPKPKDEEIPTIIPDDPKEPKEPKVPTKPEKPEKEKTPRNFTINPMVGATIGALSGLIDSPNYDKIMVGDVPKIKATPVGEKQIYNPTDVNYNLILGINQYNAALRQAVEGNQGNGSIDVSSLGIDPIAIMSEYYNANNYNFSKKNKVNTFNRDTNKFNSKQKLKADTYNQKMNDELAKLFLQAALYKDAELAAFQENRNALLTNIFNNIKNYGKDRLTQDQVMALVNTGAYGAMSDIMNPKKKGDKNA